jgi:vancomycin resistance protein YoaR
VSRRGRAEHLPRVSVNTAVGGFLLVAAAACIIALAVIAGYQIQFSNKIFPGVSVQSIDVGGLTRQEAEAAVSKAIESQLMFPVTIVYGDDTWTFSAREMGATVPVHLVIGQAYEVGRVGPMHARLLQQLTAMRQRVAIAASIQFDSGPSNVLLARIAQSIDRPARSAQVIIQDDLSIVETPGREGILLDKDATRRLIQKSILTQSTNPIAVVVRETPPAVTGTEEAVRTLESLLSQPLTVGLPLQDLLAEGIVTPQDLGRMTSLVEEVNEEGVGAIVVRPDAAEWLAYLENIAEQVQQRPIDARFEVDPETNEITILRESQVGYDLDIAQAMDLVTELYKQPASRLQLPTVIIQPAVPVHAADTYGFDNLIIEATTYFKGSSEARVRNIDVASSKFHGVVVPPNEVFSFNEHLGDVTAANGFAESLIIWGDQTAVGIGGGVCQVSTTAFRAALFGGFDIVERWAHGYRVGWYETESGPGLDATVYVPDVDFRFRNDTDGFLLIQTEVDTTAGTITFRFYGAPTGREVTVSEPVEENVTHPDEPVYRDDSSLPEGEIKQVEWEKDGVDVTVTRLVKQGEQTLHNDTFVSHYRPWQAVFLVGTGPEGTPEEGDG